MSLGPEDRLEHPTLFRRRILLVLGKGGVGRSTVACALALAAGRAGLRTALVEVHGNRTLAGWWRVAQAPQAPQPLDDGVDLWSLSAEGCLQEYGLDRFGSAWLTRLVFGGAAMRALLDAIPGMADLLHLGRINRFVEDEEAPYDLVVIDAPATGHGLALYRTADAMAAMSGRGPMHAESRRIADRLADPGQTALVLVSLPEELPVNESGELASSLRAEGRAVQLVVANQVLADPLGELSWDGIRAELVAAGLDGMAASGARLVHRLEGQERALARLAHEVPEAPVVRLERIPDAHALEGLRQLAHQLAGEVG